MAYSDKQEYKVPRHLVHPGAVNVEQISAHRTLTYKDGQYQRLDAQSGGLNVVLPAEKDGAWFVINCQGYGITVKDAGGSTIKALSVGEGGLFCCNGSSWKQFL